jgi:hypothetical protein
VSQILPKTRATRDLSGRLVDLYPAAEDTVLWVLVLGRTRLNESRLRYDVFAVMASIATMANSRLRDRDFPVYRCDWTAAGRRLTGIGLPEVFPTRLHLAFQHPIRSSFGIVEIGRGRASDVGARPFMLYNHGKLIAYADAFEEISPLPDTRIEVRSAEFESRVARRQRGKRLPVIRLSGPGTRHSIDTWNDLRSDILKFIYATITPGTFHSLRREVRRQFDIAVQVSPTSAAGKHSSISAGWVTREDQACPVTIHISQDLPDQLKYIALAHEVAHYALHFPIILAERITEQLSWLVPHARCAYTDQFEHYFGDGTGLEEEADLLAGHLLIPPQIQLTRLQRIISEVGGTGPYGNDDQVTHEELAWRLLAEYFPERSFAELSWQNYDEMRALAQRELAWARSADDTGDVTMYRMMLRAVLRRESHEGQRRSRDLVKATHEFWDNVVNGSWVFRPCSRDHDKQPPLAEVGHRGVDWQVRGPLSATQEQIPRIPLVPKSTRTTSQWINVLDLAQPAASVAEWQRRHPEHGVMLYPTRTLPDAPLFGSIQGLLNEPAD